MFKVHSPLFIIIVLKIVETLVLQNYIEPVELELSSLHKEMSIVLEG